MKDTKQRWFKDSKFGLFIHWGLYSLLAGEYQGRKTEHIAEWIMNHLDIPVKEYEKLAAEFNPVHFDAEYIVKKAKSWGMKYIVFTSKHHDGFAMYHSKCSPYNIVDATPFKRDVLKELQLACEKHDMRLGLYYSQAQDWHDPDGFMALKDNSKKNFQAYLDRKCIPQLKEILTGYGKISLIWFDTPMGTTAEQSRNLVSLVKSIQPDCLVSGRIGNDLGDYMTTSDNFIPLRPYRGDWEVPATLNDTWGFNKDDHNWKDPNEVIRLLVKINSRGGNYLLNIGPDALGRVPQDSIRILDQVGTYVNENAGAIFGTTVLAEPYPYDLNWAEFTHKPRTLFIHVFIGQKRVIYLPNIGNKVEKATLLKTGEALSFESQKDCEGNSVIEVALPSSLRQQANYCVALGLAEEGPVFETIR
ncbi:MAG: alpha-L-fucosidase [Spirochaetaceae bacterium]|jgi:alpha-L-fucosidase|nr:alpha-L-fucosidase [Spirochaetaceae bacterium]